MNAQLFEDTSSGLTDPQTKQTVYPVVKLVRRATWVWELVRNFPAGFEEERIWKDTHYSCTFRREEILAMHPEMRKVT